MLDLERIDLAELCVALEDQSAEASWWLDPKTGTLERVHEDFGAEDEDDPGERGWMYVEPIASHDAYRDLEDFASRVRDPRARELLERAIGGRGAFRRFKDTLFEFPELRQAWFAFHDARMQRRAIRWLGDQELIGSEEVERAVSEHPDPDLSVLGGAFDAEAVARQVAEELCALYGDRLRDVLLFGSWARGDAHPESDIDLLVVLDDVQSRWTERERMHEVLWRHSLHNDTVVTALPVSRRELDQPTIPALIRARAEGRSVA